MWLVLKTMVLRWLFARTFGTMLALLLAVLLPLAGVLKAVGLPLLLVLLVAGAPIFIVLALLGLPVLVVVAAGGVLLAMLVAVLTLGLLAVKIVVPVVLVVWFVRWAFGGPKDRPHRPKPHEPPDLI